MLRGATISLVGGPAAGPRPQRKLSTGRAGPAPLDARRSSRPRRRHGRPWRGPDASALRPVPPGPSPPTLRSTPRRNRPGGGASGGFCPLRRPHRGGAPPCAASHAAGGRLHPSRLRRDPAGFGGGPGRRRRAGPLRVSPPPPPSRRLVGAPGARPSRAGGFAPATSRAARRACRRPRRPAAPPTGLGGGPRVGARGSTAAPGAPPAGRSRGGRRRSSPRAAIGAGAPGRARSARRAKHPQPAVIAKRRRVNMGCPSAPSG